MTTQTDVQASIHALGLRISRKAVEEAKGKQYAGDLHDWAVKRCDTDPIFNLKMLAADDPYDAADKARTDEQILAVVKPEDLEAFKAWKASHGDTDEKAPAKAATETAKAPAKASTAVPKHPDPAQPGEAFKNAFGS